MKPEEIHGKFQKGELVQVNWFDICSEDDISPEKRGEVLFCRSVGWYDGIYAGEVPETLVIVTEFKGKDIVDKQAFPLGCVDCLIRLKS